MEHYLFWKGWRSAAFPKPRLDGLLVDIDVWVLCVLYLPGKAGTGHHQVGTFEQRNSAHLRSQCLVFLLQTLDVDVGLCVMVATMDWEKYAHQHGGLGCPWCDLWLLDVFQAESVARG